MPGLKLDKLPECPFSHNPLTICVIDNAGVTYDYSSMAALLKTGLNPVTKKPLNFSYVVSNKAAHQLLRLVYRGLLVDRKSNQEKLDDLIEAFKSEHVTLGNLSIFKNNQGRTQAEILAQQHQRLVAANLANQRLNRNIHIGIILAMILVFSFVATAITMIMRNVVRVLNAEFTPMARIELERQREELTDLPMIIVAVFFALFVCAVGIASYLGYKKNQAQRTLSEIQTENPILQFYDVIRETLDNLQLIENALKDQQQPESESAASTLRLRR